MMCVDSLGDYPKPLCHLAPEILVIQQSKRKQDKGQDWACEQTCHSQEALGRLLRPKSQRPSRMESRFSYASQRAQSWLFPVCPGKFNRGQKASTEIGCTRAERDPRDFYFTDAGFEVHIVKVTQLIQREAEPMFPSGEITPQYTLQNFTCRAYSLACMFV